MRVIHSHNGFILFVYVDPSSLGLYEFADEQRYQSHGQEVRQNA